MEGFALLEAGYINHKYCSVLSKWLVLHRAVVDLYCSLKC